MPSSSLWQRFQRYFLYYRDLDFSLDISRLKFPEDFFEKMQPKIGKAFVSMRELEADALGSARDPMNIFFFDNTDPNGFDRVFDRIDALLPQTLVVVVSKSGGTNETRNGMLETEARFKEKGLHFNKHAVAVTGVGSNLDKNAEKNEWLARFPMYDWIGGRTSVMSAVGLLPMALEGFDIDRFLAGDRKSVV